MQEDYFFHVQKLRAVYDGLPGSFGDIPSRREQAQAGSRVGILCVSNAPSALRAVTGCRDCFGTPDMRQVLLAAE